MWSEDWKNIEQSSPTYYEVVQAVTIDGDVIEMWGAWSETAGIIYTIFGTNKVLFEQDIVKWRRYKLEEKK